MRKLYIIILLLFSYYNPFAQNTAPSKLYYDYQLSRLSISQPEFGKQKIEALIKKTKTNDDDENVLDQKTYLSLSLRERFAYNVIHPESFSQNCDIMPIPEDAKDKIFAQLPGPFGDYSWSERQLKFFSVNHDSVIAWMKYCITKDNRIGINFKQVIVDINAKDLIPLIISTYNISKKDHDLLTVLMLLMKDNEYGEFLTSTSYKKLYADRNASYKAYLNFNEANEALIIQRATNFYNGIKK